MKALQIAKVRKIYSDKKCAHCGWLSSAVSKWCKNEEIIKMSGTSLHSICHCPGWKPDKKYIKEIIKL